MAIALHRQAWTLVAAVLIARVTSPAFSRSDNRQTASPERAKLESEDKRSMLMGTWVSFATEDPASNSASMAGNNIKVITNNSFALTVTDPQTGEVRFHHGGRYTFDGDEYSETIEYANVANKTLVNRTFRFRMQIQGDTFRQVGLGNRWTEIWKRLVATDAASQLPFPVLSCESSPEGRNALLELNRTAGVGLELLGDTPLKMLLTEVEKQPILAKGYLDLARCQYTQRHRSEAVSTLSHGLRLIQHAGSAESPNRAVALVPSRFAKLKDVKPIYPEDAAQTRVTGIVIIRAALDRAGHVADASIVRSVPMLDAAALEAVRQWQYVASAGEAFGEGVVIFPVVKFGAASPIDGIDAGRFFLERRQFGESEEAVAQALTMINVEIQRASHDRLHQVGSITAESGANPRWGGTSHTQMRR